MEAKGEKMTSMKERRVLTTGNFKEMPKIVVLCGSTKFYKSFEDANLKETLAGNIVLSIGCSVYSDATLEISVQQKIRLDELHKRKIDLADEVFVLNVGGYIGDSTRREIEYAKALGMPIRYLYPI